MRTNTKTNTKAKQRREQARRRSKRRGVLIGGGVLALALAAAIALAGGGESPDRPPLAVDRFDGFDGAPAVELSAFRGRPLIINFWASWCVPCLAEMPGFERVYQARRDSVAFLGVNLIDDPSAARVVVERTGITYPLAADLDGSAFTALGGYGMPTTVFVDPDGRVVELYTGELTADELDQRIQRYFGV